MHEETKRLWIDYTQMGVHYFSMKYFLGWWYLRILRWMRMTTLREFLMRWFYEPFYGIMFDASINSIYYDTEEEETKRLLVLPSETKRTFMVR